MASTSGYADYVVEQLAPCGAVSTRKMFGQYAVYVGAKVAGFICDDTLLIKVTQPGLAMLDQSQISAEYGKPYPGAKDYLVVTFLDQSALAAEFVAASIEAIPEPKPKKPRAKR